MAEPDDTLGINADDLAIADNAHLLAELVRIFSDRTQPGYSRIARDARKFAKDLDDLADQLTQGRHG